MIEKLYCWNCGTSRTLSTTGWTAVVCTNCEVKIPNPFGVTEAQRIDYLLSGMGEQDIDQYYEWATWCEENKPDSLPTQTEFRPIYAEIDWQRLSES